MLIVVDPSSGVQELIYLGQVTDISRVLIEVSVPLSAERLYYETYSASDPKPVINTISLTS